MFVGTGWRRLIGSPKLQIIFHKRATKYRSLLRKMTYKDKGSYESSPPYTTIVLFTIYNIARYICMHTYTYTYIHTYIRTYMCTRVYIHRYTQPNNTNISYYINILVCCSVLQCVAVCCSVLQCVAYKHVILYKYIGVLCKPVHCTTILQHTATHCNTLQHTPTHIILYEI